MIRKKRGLAKIITANNVFAHIDDPINFLKGIKALLCKEEGIFVFEVSYLKDVIENTYFDTMYTNILITILNSRRPLEEVDLKLLIIVLILMVDHCG